MVNNEDMANYVAANTESYLMEDRQKGKDWMVPPPPKPGEYIICQICGKVMMPEDFSKDQKIRKHEFKWHIHYQCELNIFDQLDRETHGLLAERKSGSNLNEYKKKTAQAFRREQ